MFIRPENVFWGKVVSIRGKKEIVQDFKFYIYLIIINYFTREMDLAMQAVGSGQNRERARQQELYRNDLMVNPQGIPLYINPENYNDPDHPQLMDEFITQLANRHADQHIRQEAKKYLEVKAQLKNTIKIQELQIYEELLKDGKDHIKQLNQANQQTQQKISELRNQLLKIGAEIQKYKETIQQVLIPHLKLLKNGLTFEVIEDIAKEEKTLFEEEKKKFEEIKRKIQELGEQTINKYNAECSEISQIFDNASQCKKELHELKQKRNTMEIQLNSVYCLNNRKKYEIAQKREQIRNQEIKKVLAEERQEQQKNSVDSESKEQEKISEKTYPSRKSKNIYFSCEQQGPNLFYISLMLAWTFVLILATLSMIV